MSRYKHNSNDISTVTNENSPTCKCQAVGITGRSMYAIYPFLLAVVCRRPACFS